MNYLILLLIISLIFISGCSTCPTLEQSKEFCESHNGTLVSKSTCGGVGLPICVIYNDDGTRSVYLVNYESDNTSKLYFSK